MKTLGEIISLRQNKYNEDRKNPSFSDFFQGRFDGWYSAYRDLKEILEQNGFNLDVPVIDVGKTNADHIRSMTDEELVAWLEEVDCYCDCCAYQRECRLEYNEAKHDCVTGRIKWLKQLYKEET